MNIEELDQDALWRHYQRGYHSLIRSGLYFRQVLRPALSHVYFLRAMPLLVEYARANHGRGDLPPGFGDQMEACPLTPRDLLHLDYAISLGLAESQGHSGRNGASLEMIDWPGPGGGAGLFIAADAISLTELGAFQGEADEEEEAEEDNDEDPKPPFDL